MILLWIASISWCLAIIGLGRWCRPALGCYGSDQALHFSALLGVAAAQTVSITWNFIEPVSARFAGVLLVLGWSGLALPRRSHGPRLDFERLLLLAVFAGAIVPWLTTRVHYQHDVGYYALPSVRWAQVSALPLGLANINARHGFNSGWFLLDALLRRPLLPDDTLPSMAPVVVITLVLAFGAFAVRRLPASTRTSAAALACLTIVLLLGSTTVVWGLNSPLGDLPVLIAWIVMATLLLPRSSEQEVCPSDLMGAALVAVLAITAKLSALPLALVPVLLAWRGSLPRRSILAAAGLSAIVLLPWLVRGYWTSGCFLFPVPVSCVPRVWWSTPLPWVQQEAVNVVNWAKEPYWSDHGFVRSDWILPWLKRCVRSAEMQVPLVVTGAALVLGHGVSLSGGRARAKVLGVAIIAQLLLVAARAPDPRFVMGPLWVAALSTAWIRMRDTSPRRFAVFLLVCFVLLVPSSSPGWRDQTRGLRHAGERPALWVMPPKLDPDVPFSWMDVDGGRIRVASPEMRPAPACWGIEPPCSPGRSEGLHIRSSADGSRIVGFSLDTKPAAGRGTRRQ